MIYAFPEEINSKIILFLKHPIASILETFCFRYTSPLVCFWRMPGYKAQGFILKPTSDVCSFYEYMTWKIIKKSF